MDINEPVVNEPAANEPVFFENEVFERSYFPLPDSDYDADGNLRKVRKRMVKKLFRYEWRALWKPMTVAGVILAAISLLLLFFGLSARSSQDPSMSTYWALAFLPYAYALGAVVLMPFILSSKRYKKHFFGNEGYLTFSIPASAEEHLLAKRLSAFLALLVGEAAALLSLVLVLQPLTAKAEFMNGFTAAFKELFFAVSGESMVHIVLFSIEEFILSLAGTVAFFSLIGAERCIRHRGVKTRTIVFACIIGYIAIVVGQSVVIASLDNAIIAFFDSVAWLHIYTWLQILMAVGVTVLCTWYELRTLKYKLNLK